ncbi:hypothetical protein Pla108_13290 [Botrimarina colliarenosi]|uniref:DUF1772 domain-containing protein n=1 Tax=Botrimarina colliarenosi TaxID=2528001 RepID=A0A5C6AL53_9BACT|nr:hypothetical protein [Botrimarina colliarenosi]TWU00380.1 hypothetical protein Pla108_13290 [Botrimarina colliarenosi]
MAVWLLYAQLFASIYMTGLIWMVQLVHYPMMAEVPAERFVEWERVNVVRTGWAVGPMMLLEIGTACAMLAMRPPGVPIWVAWLGIALLLLVDGSTAVFFGPQHGRLASGFDATLHRQLVDWNWLRTFGWTARGLLMVYATHLWAIQRG